MEKSSNQSQISKNDDNTFTIIQSNVNYKLNINIKSNTLHLIIKMNLSPCYYEAIYTIEDLRSLNSVFNSFDNLDDIYNEFTDLFTQNLFEFINDNEKIQLKFFISLGRHKKEVKIVLNKATQQQDTSIIIEEMSKVIHMLSEKNNFFEEKLNEISKKLHDIELEKENRKTLKSSRIINSEEIPLLIDWLKQSNFNPKSFELIYRATKHGKNAQSFHSRCDNRGSTVSFIKTTNGKRFGGFTTLKWDSVTNNYKANDPYAFLFRLDKRQKLSCNLQTNIIYCHAGHVITFGGGHDIYISPNFDGNSSTNCTHSFGKNEGVSINYLVDSTSSPYFIPEEVEVYLVDSM